MELKSATKSRTIVLNSPLPNDQLDHNALQHQIYQPLQIYPSNEIRTSKYTLISFLPKNLFEQFRRVANSFFLFLIILQSFPAYKVISVSVVATPMIFIVAVTAFKDAFEDYRRHRNDVVVNSRPVIILGGDAWRNYNSGMLKRGSWTSTLVNAALRLISLDRYKMADYKRRGKQQMSEHRFEWNERSWKDVQVGDIVKLSNNNPVPADIVILSTSEEECACFVETKNLDGETNLKLRQGSSSTKWLQSPSDVGERFKCALETEAPTPNLARYQGSLKITMSATDSKTPNTISIDGNGILLRGTVVKNTEWVIGLVFNTGIETKQSLNSGITPSKQSEMEKLMNRHIGYNLVFMILLCLVGSIGYGWWNELYQDSRMLYDLRGRNFVYSAFLNIWGCLILFQNIVPISLYISIEFAKTLQAYFIQSDIELYHEATDTPCVARTWNLADNLGQIEYIFSDKTGTLTRNIMEFKKCSINGMLFEGQHSSNFGCSKSSLSKSHRSLVIQSDWVDTVRSRAVSQHSLKHWDIKKSHAIEEDNDVEENSVSNAWYDSALNDIMEDPQFPKSDKGEAVNEFFKLLSLCHTVLVDRDPKTEVISFKAQSPDESCLVTMAAESGYVFMSRKQSGAMGQSMITIEVNDVETSFILLNILEFDSERKRMSVIVKSVETGEIIVYCKGADSVIYERLAEGQSVVLELTNRHLERFAEEGLRTLCLAYRVLTPDDYREWAMRYHNAQTTIFEDPAERAHQLELLNELVECDFQLLGATAIEDKLQDGVPECITTLMKAGIKFWVLTGDKMETAINVGFLCGLLKSRNNEDEMILLQIRHSHSEDDLRRQLDNSREQFGHLNKRNSRHPTREYALVIDGASLKHVVENQSLVKEFLEIACRCKTVICCRVSPLQKAKVVEMVTSNKNVVTLAIGDGANDVSMIQTAHVGIGISGEEGLQAALSADYAIAQFRYLLRLLLVHGRWSYQRNSYMILNFNVKSLVFSLVVFWFQFQCGFSSAVIFEFTYMIFYNTLFTSLPIMGIACFDRDLSAESCLNFPQLYSVEGIAQRAYTTRKYFLYLVESIWHSLISYFFATSVYASGGIDATGQTPDIYFIGTVMALTAVWVVNLSPALDSHTWTIMHHLFYWSCSIGTFAYVWLLSSIPGAVTRGISPQLFGGLNFWLTFVLVIVVSLGPRLIAYAIQRHFYPSDSQICHEIQMLNRRPPQRNQHSHIDKEMNLEERENSLGRTSTTANNATIHPATAYEAERGTQTTHRGFTFAHSLGVSTWLMRGARSLSHSFQSTHRGLSRPSSRASTNRAISNTHRTPVMNTKRAIKQSIFPE
eukprot:Partr_v1_DN28699_c1_g1_i1_m50503 putative ATPase, class VI, type